MKPSLRLIPILFGLLLFLTAHGEEKQGQAVDPFAAPAATPAPAIPPERLIAPRAAIQLRAEIWEVSAKEMAGKLDAGQDGAALDKWRTEWLEAKEGVKLILASVISLDAATKMTAESVTELIYPTEYNAPESLTPPAGPGSKEAWQKWLESITGLSFPTSFETRNTGETLEAIAEPVSVGKGLWDVSLTVEDVHFMGFTSHGDEASKIKMPNFSSFRTGGLVRLREGEWRLLSVLSPPTGASADRPGSRWVTLVRIDPVKTTP